MDVIFKGEKIEIGMKKVSFFGRFRGLMFRPKNTENLLFEFSKPEFSAIHSLFVFFPFLAIWMNEKNNVLDYEIVRPFTLSVKPKNSAKRLAEIPFNQKNKKILKLFVDKRKDLNIT